MNQLEEMSIFVQVVKSGSFVKASRALHISTAKASVFVARLEKRLKAQLLDRSTKALCLTNAGSIYFLHCQRVLSDIEQMDADLLKSTKQPTGCIHIDSHVTLTKRFLLPLLVDFRKRFPEVSFEWSHSEHIFDLGHNACDVMFRVGPVDDCNLVAITIGFSKMATVGAPSYFDKYGEPKHPEDLVNHDCLQFVDPNSGRFAEWNYAKDGKDFLIRTHGSHAFNEGESRIAAAVMGFGLMHGSEIFLHELIRAGKLRAVLSEWQTIAQPILLLYPQSRYLATRVKAFVQFLKESCPPSVELYPPRSVMDHS